jgi:hypothetical protein
MAITIGPGISLGRGAIVGNGTPPGGILTALRNCAIDLNILTGITSLNLGTAQSVIQSSNIHFNVFAVVSKGLTCESLTGTAAPSGFNSFTASGFYYNSSAANILSTGNNIFGIEGGIDYGLPELDGLGWMAMAVFNSSGNFVGLMVWIFTNDTIDSVNSVTPNGHPVTTAASIFYPDNGPNSYNRIYAMHIDGFGNITVDTSGNMRYNYSNNQNPTSAGYNATNKFSNDDGVWAFVMGGKTDGNAPGPTFAAANGFGIGTYDSIESLSLAYWNGSALAGTDWVGFVFTGDRIP